MYNKNSKSNKNNTIAVVFGGVSNENEISVITGTMACNILKNGGESVLPVYVSTDGDIFADESLSDINAFKDGGYSEKPRAIFGDGGVYIKNSRGKIKRFIKLYCALNCCHGGFGEGGGLAGLFAVCGIPFAGAGMFESAAFIDKYYTKLVLSSLGVTAADYRYITSPSRSGAAASQIGYPVIVKPARLGSSIGIAKAENEAELHEAVSAAFCYDGGVLIEKYLDGKREINCAAYFADGKVLVSPCEESIPRGELLSYDDKYSGGGKSVFPADIPDSISENIRRTTAKIYSRLYMRGIVRFDYILCGGEIYLSEINTVPGSLAYYLLSKGFKNFYPVLQAVIAQAREDFAESRQKTILHTGILKNFASNGCKSK